MKGGDWIKGNDLVFVAEEILQSSRDGAETTATQY